MIRAEGTGSGRSYRGAGIYLLYGKRLLSQRCSGEREGAESAFTPGDNPLIDRLFLLGHIIHEAWSCHGSNVVRGLWIDQPVEHAAVGQVERNDNGVGAGRTVHVAPVGADTH